MVLGPTPKITKLIWNIVDPPWNFYSVWYELDNYSEHIVYIPTKTIAEELKSKDIVQIVLDKLKAELDCDPVHIDRITKKMQDETRKRAETATRGSRKSKLA